MKHLYKFLLLSVIFFSQFNLTKCIVSNSPEPYRIIVLSDIGGTDYDDYQSMAHLLVYADTFDIEGIISSPYGDGRKEDILEAVDEYEIDYPKLSAYSNRYPTADSLRKIVKQGAIENPGPIGYGGPTEGSDWIIECARRNDARPLNILIWGGQFVRAWERPHKVFNRTTTVQDSIEQFGVLELLLPVNTDTISNPVATLNIDRPIQALVKDDTVRFLFSPKNPHKSLIVILE